MSKSNPLVLFDGVCNLCNNSIKFILKRDKKKQFRFVALQSEKGQKLIKEYKIPSETDSVILIRNNKAFTESEAAIEICQLLPTPWNWVSFLKIIPQKWRDRIYRWVAKNRYRWFGKQETFCHFDDTGGEISF